MRIGLLLILIAALGTAVYMYRTEIPYLNDFFPSESKSKFQSKKKHKKKPHSPTQRNTFNIDEKTKEEIKAYFKGIKLNPKNNYMKYAMDLDSKKGRKQLSRGNYKGAYKTYQEVLAISYNNKNLRGIGVSLGYIANILNKAGDKENALKTYLLQHKITETMHAPHDLGVVQLSISRMLAYKNESLSLMWLMKARDNLKGTHYKRDTVSVLEELGSKHYYQGHKEKAGIFYKDAWDLALTLGKSRYDRWARWEAGKLYSIYLQKTDNYQNSLNILEHITKEFPVVEMQGEMYSETLFLISKSYSKLKYTEQADNSYHKAYIAYQHARSKSLGDVGRAKLDSKFNNYIDEYINHLITNNKYMHALVTIESNKAPTLNDIMEDVYQKDVYQKLSDLNTKHQLEIQDFIKQNSQTSEISDENILIKYSQITQKQQQEKKELEISLNIRTVPVSSSLSANDIHLAQNHLPDDTAILSFYISKELSGLFILLNNSKKFVKLNIDENSLYLLASELRASIINPYTDYYKESSVKLYSALFGEVLKHLNKNIKNLIVVSDNVLSSIPFSPLYDGKSFLIENYSIYRVPSLRFIKSFAI